MLKLGPVPRDVLPQVPLYHVKVPPPVAVSSADVFSQIVGAAEVIVGATSKRFTVTVTERVPEGGQFALSSRAQYVVVSAGDTYNGLPVPADEVQLLLVYHFSEIPAPVVLYVAVSVAVPPVQIVAVPLIDVGVCGRSETVTTTDEHAEGGQTMLLYLAKYLVVSVGATTNVAVVVLVSR